MKASNLSALLLLAFGVSTITLANAQFQEFGRRLANAKHKSNVNDADATDASIAEDEDIFQGLNADNFQLATRPIVRRRRRRAMDGPGTKAVDPAIDSINDADATDTSPATANIQRPLLRRLRRHGHGKTKHDTDSSMPWDQ